MFAFSNYIIYAKEHHENLAKIQKQTLMRTQNSRDKENKQIFRGRRAMP
jgi:hypothetical protein